MPLTVVQAGVGGTGTTTGFNNFKNRIINGAMVIDQRNAGASVTPTADQYGIDRFNYFLSQSSKFTAQQNGGSVTPPVGFTNYMGLTVGASANVTVGAGDYFGTRQFIEGYNVADLAWGTANAKTVTLSFWVRSSLTGTFGGALNNNGQTRSYPFTYTISSVNTWEYKTVTIPGDTSGTWNTTNGVGIEVRFALGGGSSFSSAANAWATGNFVTANGATNIIATNSATLYLTGVQLEASSTASGFDYRPYGTELILCQRYYEKSYDLFTVPGTAGVAGNWTTVGNTTYPRVAQRFIVEKRATPTMTFYADSDGTTGNLNIWDGGTVRKVAATNIFITSKLTSPEGDYASLLSTRSFLYYNWVASAEL